MERQNSSYRWVVLACILLDYFLIVIQRTAPGLISDKLMTDFHVTAATIGVLASIQFLAYAGLQIPVGILSDRYGPNGFLILGTLLNGFGTLLYSLAAHESILLIARLLVGIGDATIWINVVLILGNWFRAKEFVKLIGLAGVSGSLGFLVATAPFSEWIAMAGWRVPFLTSGIVLILTSGLLFYVLVWNLKRRFPEMSGSHSAAAADAMVKKKRDKVMTVLRRILGNRQSWATFLCHFGLVGTYVGFIGSWAVPYGMNVYGMSRSGASGLAMAGLIGALVGGPLATLLASRLPSMKRPYAIVHAVVFLSWMAIYLWGGKPPLVMATLLFVLIGFGNGSSALTFAVVRDSFDIREVGVASGFANTGGFLSAILLPSLFGRVLDHLAGSGTITGYHQGFLIPALFALVGLAGALLLREKVDENERGEEGTVPSK
ncbi:MFS transporter [Paenibacillus aurantius]|uniref:MFS transporter n=1 Tax=Paenibacillus aurantius TaxID=2918900 RepID=A0AA96RFP4_9BACL|nr:MFS transporter [Paenibacillus aurantius]WNQ11458.1 MFS transporter [Paenibacillus aurantius]